MDTYECVECGKHTEIEKIHMLIDVPEHVEFRNCKECFDKSLSDHA